MITKLPRPLFYLVLFFGVAAVVGALGFIVSSEKVWRGIAEACSLLMLSGTFIALIYYVYYTYLIAKDLWVPTVGFHLQFHPAYPGNISLLISNESKQSVQVYVALSAFIDKHSDPILVYFEDQPLDGKSQWRHLSEGSGYEVGFDIEEILKVRGFTLIKMTEDSRLGNTELKRQLRFYLRLQFYAERSAFYCVYPAKHYYFDFRWSQLRPFPISELQKHANLLDPWWKIIGNQSYFSKSNPIGED